MSQTAKLGDILQMNLNNDPQMRPEFDNWIKFWNFPLRDQDDVTEAQKIIDTGGMCFYSKPNYKRQFRVVPATPDSIPVVREIEHFFNTRTGKPIGMTFGEASDVLLMAVDDDEISLDSLSV